MANILASITRLVGRSRTASQASKAVTKGAAAQMRETLAILVSLKAGMKAAVPEAIKVVAKNAGKPTLLSSLRNALRHIIKAIVKPAALNPRQKITVHASASTPFVNIPAVLKTRADILTSTTPVE